MPERKLKNFKEYLRRLTLFASAVGVKIEYGDIASEGVWLPTLRKVKIDEDLSNSEEIASILHELGHSLDDLVTEGAPGFDALCKAYTSLYDSSATKKQRRLVIKCEQRAWNYGRDIAKRLNIRLGKWYDESEKAALKSYREA